MMPFYYRLKFRLSVLIALFIVLSAFLLSHLVADKSRAQIEQDQSILLKQVAMMMMSRLDHDMSARGGEIISLTHRERLRTPTVSTEQKQAILNEIRKFYPYYAWIGMTDIHGNIVAGTEDHLVGKNVSKRAWFLKGKNGLHFGDAHYAFLLAKMMPKPKWDDLPLRLVDVSAPILDQQGHFQGVICGHLSLDWAFEARNKILDQLQGQGLDLVVLNKQGKVMLGTPKLPSLTLDLDRLKTIQLAQSGKVNTQIETWPDGKQYLTSAVKESGFNHYPGMDWVIVARKLESVAFASAEQLQNLILFLALLVAATMIVLIIVVINRQLRPLSQLTEAAQRLNLAEHSVTLPCPEGKEELAVLTRGLSRLLASMYKSNAELRLTSRIFDESGQGIMITDADMRIVRVNNVFTKTTGYSSKEAIGRYPSILQSGQHNAAFYAKMRNGLNEVGFWQGEIWNKQANGQVYPEWLSIYTLKDDAGNISHYIGIFDDITDKKQAEQKLLELAYHDQLTQLPNNYAMNGFVEKVIEDHKLKHERFAFIFIDIDKFKHMSQLQNSQPSTTCMNNSPS